MDNKADRLITSVLRYEGGYTADQNDAGNSGGYETYRGITRKNYPNWEGWKIVDQHKPLRTNQIISSTSLDMMVKDFYYKNFYLKMSIDKLENIVLAAHTFDHGVNAGTKSGVKMLQKAINKVTNANIAVDGIMGKQTIGLANSERSSEIGKEISNQRKAFYRTCVANKPSNQRYLSGWLRRVDKVDAEYGSVINGATIDGGEGEKGGLGKVISGTILGKATDFLSALANFFYSLAGLRNK